MGKEKHNVKHYRNVRKFLQQILRDNEEEKELSSDEVSYKWGRIPEELLTEEAIQSNLFSFAISGNLLKAFDEVFDELRDDRETEHLTDKAIEDKLWFLTCDICVKRDFYRKHNAEFQNRVKRFLEDLYQPLEEYTVIFQILNFDLQSPPINILDAVILKATDEELVNRGFNPHQDNHKKIFQSCKEQTIMLLTLFGDNNKLIIERAKRKAHFILKILQLNLSDSYVFEDKYLLFDISTHIILKTDNSVEQNWEEKKDPCCLVYTTEKVSSNVTENIAHFELVEKFPVQAKEAVERAVFWIGKAISEPEYDVKVTFLCIAMEALLTIKGDHKKGQAIAYRMVLLRSLLEPNKGFTDPFKIFWIYDELRSNIVHGSAIFVANQEDYKEMRYAAKEVLSNFITVVEKFNIKNVSQLIDLLDTSQEIEERRRWCEQFVKPLCKVGELKKKYF